MDSKVAFGSHSHVVQPVNLLLKECQNLNEKYRNSQDSNIQILMSYLPLIDSAKLDNLLSDVQASNFKTLLKQNGYDINLINSSLFQKYSFSSENADIQTALIFLYCILTFIIPSIDQNFNTFLSLLHKTIPSHLTVVRNFCFELVLSNILSAPNQHDFYEVALNYILDITSIAPTSFPILITLFKLVAKTGTKTEISLSRKVIAHMFECDFSCIQDVEVSSLVEPLLDDIMNFDRNSLIVLGSGTRKGKVSINTMQIIHNLYKKFISFVERNSTAEPLIELNKNTVFKLPGPTKIPQHNYQIYNKPEFKFVAPNLDSVSVTEKFPSVISDKVNQLSDIISDFLSNASNEIFLDFLGQFPIFLQQKKNFIDILCVLLKISEKLIKPQSIRTFLHILSQTQLFSPLQTVFEPENFDQRINYLRDQIFNLIISIDPSQVSILFILSQQYPFLLNEHFLRILRQLESYPLSIFTNESNRSIFASSMLDLQSSNRPDLELVRSTNFCFISNILKNPSISNSLFSSSQFVSSFLQFALEPGLLDFTMNTFTKSMAHLNSDYYKELKMSSIITFLQNIMSSCTSKFRNPNYQRLYQKVSNSIILSMRYNNNIVQHFYILLNSFLDYMKASPSVENVIKCLNFIQVNMMSFASWELSPHQYSMIFSSVRYICTDEPDDRIVTSLFSILQKSSFTTPNANNFLIHCPSVLPLILAIHGKSKKNIDILKIFLELCKYSRQNCVAMHEGYIDHLLIQYLIQNEDRCYVNFRDKAIEFYFERKNSLNLILELLQLIILSKATFSTAFSLSTLLGSADDEILYNFVSNLLLNGMNVDQMFTNLPLDSNMPSIQVNGVDWNSLKNMFTINFKLNLDEAISKNCKISYTIFEATDDVNRFVISLKNGAISASFITPISTSTTFLFRNIFVSDWSQFSIISSPAKDKHKFYNFINKERMPDSTLDPIVFGKGPVVIRIGGSDFKYYSQMRHPCFGKMLGFSFYPNCLNDDEISLLADSPESFKQRPLFSTNDIQSEANKVIRYNSITMTLLPVFHRVMHILDFFCEPLLFERIITLKNLSYGLDFLYYSFIKHPEIQPFFNHVSQLAEIVSKNPKYSIYLSLYRFMDIIECQDLYNQWFEKLILNISVWGNSDKLFNIIRHWENDFSVNKSLFLEKNFFSSLLSQFVTLPQDDSKKQTETTKLFYHFLLKLAHLKFTKQNFDVLLHCIFECRSMSILKDLIDILFAVSNYEVVIQSIDEETLSLLHRVFKVKDTDILVKMVLCIHNLRVRIPNYSMMSISYFFLDFNDIVSFIDQLLDKLNNYPKLLSLLTILCIHTHKCDDLVMKIDSNIKSDKPTLFSIIDDDYWYVWPIILILNVSFTSCDIVTKLIATCLSLTNGSDQIDQVFAMMFRMSFFIPRYDMIGELLKKLYAFYEETKAPIPETVVEYFFIFFFIHIPQELHSSPLLDLIDKSPYPKMRKPRSSSIIYNKINIFELEELLNDEFLKFDPQCRISLDDNGKVSNTYYYEIYQTFKTQRKSKFDKRLMEYFIERDKIDQQTQAQMAQNLTNTMDSFKISAINDIVKTLVKIQKGVLLLITKSKEIVNNSSAPRKRTTRSSTVISRSPPSISQQQQQQQKELKKSSSFFSKDEENNYKLKSSSSTPKIPSFQPLVSTSSSSLQQQQQKITIVRANIFCSCFCPFRIRIKQSNSNEIISQPPIIDPQKIPGTLIRTFFSVIVNLDKRIKYMLCVYNDKFVFYNKNHCKIIPFEKVMFLFDRKFANNNGYELYLYNRKSYLFILQNSEFNELTSVIKTIHFNEAKMILLPSDSIDLSEITSQWMIGNISNFEYLMELNLYSDHSFKNELIYPVMPPIVSDLNDLKSNPNFLLFDRNSFRRVSLTPVINLKEVFVDQLLVQPEFFFDPSIVSNCSLPTWAKTKFEFVYLSRKKLESYDISQFIDYAFGVKINSSPSSRNSSNGEKRKLFKKEHPKRIEKFEQPKTNRFPTGKFIDAALVGLYPSRDGSLNLGFSIIFRNPRIFRKLELTEGLAQMKYNSQGLKLDNEDLIFFYSQHHIYAYSRIRYSVLLFNVTTSVLSIPLYTELPLFAGLDDSIIFCRDECLLCIMPLENVIQQIQQIQQQQQQQQLLLQQQQQQEDNHLQTTASGPISLNSLNNHDLNSQPSFSLPSRSPLLDQQFTGDVSRSSANDIVVNDSNQTQNSSVLKTAPYSKFWFAEAKITALAASNVFKIVAFSTIDGFIHVHDLVTTKEISRINLNYEVKQIVITLNWGFVVASSEEMITILSPNGEQIKSFRAPFVIDKIFTCSIKAGFDYISFSTFENQVGYFEAMYPESWTDLKKCDSSVIRITYDNLHRTFVIIEEGGDISLIPINISVSI